MYSGEKAPWSSVNLTVAALNEASLDLDFYLEKPQRSQRDLNEASLDFYPWKEPGYFYSHLPFLLTIWSNDSFDLFTQKFQHPVILSPAPAGRRISCLSKTKNLLRKHGEESSV